MRRRGLRAKPIAAVMLALWVLAGLAFPALADASPKSDNPWEHTDWFSVYLLLLGPPLALVIVAFLKTLGVFDPRCPECQSKLHVYEECITPATNEEPGEMARIRHCDNCFYHSETRYTVMGLGDKPTKWDFWYRNFGGGGSMGGGVGGNGGSGGGAGGGGGRAPATAVSWQ